MENQDIWRYPSVFLQITLFKTAMVPCFLPWKESLHLSHSHTGKIVVGGCLEIWCLGYLQSCLVFCSKGRNTSASICMQRYFLVLSMAHSRNIGEKNGFHQLTDLYMSPSSNVFSLFLISKTVSPGASLGVIMLSLSHVSFLCFLIIFVGMSSLLIVSFIFIFWTYLLVPRSLHATNYFH